MRCASCGTSNDAGRRFCLECGTRLASGCPNCGAENPPAAKYCGKCGTALGAAPAALEGSPAAIAGVANAAPTNIIIHAATDGPCRPSSLAILTAVAQGRAPSRTSTSVIEEGWHIEMSGRIGAVDGLAQRACQLFSPLLSVTDETIRVALSLQATTLGANDRIHVASCHQHCLHTIVSADGGFDRAPRLRRVDPVETRHLSHLLGR